MVCIMIFFLTLVNAFLKKGHKGVFNWGGCKVVWCYNRGKAYTSIPEKIKLILVHYSQYYTCRHNKKCKATV